MEATLEPGEVYPMSHNAMVYVRENLDILTMEAIASTALSGDRTAELCNSTIERLFRGDPVSDRYLLGLAWMLKEIKDQ